MYPRTTVASYVTYYAFNPTSEIGVEGADLDMYLILKSWVSKQLSISLSRME